MVISSRVDSSWGATPVFCDIDPLTFNINPSEITKLINKKTKAIVPISLFGQICDIEKINKISKKYKLKVMKMQLKVLEVAKVIKFVQLY